MEGINNNTKIGDKIKMHGDSIYKVTNIYQLTDDYMKKHNLIHKKRIALEKLEGEGQEKLDFAFRV